MISDDVCFACEHPRHLHKDGGGICIQQSALPADPCHCNLFRVKPPTFEVVDHDGTVGEPGATVEMELQTSDIQPLCSTCNGRGKAWGPVGCPRCCTDDPCRVHVGCRQPASIHGCCGDPHVDGEHICPLDLIPKEFIMAMGRVMRSGLKDGRQMGDWQGLPRLVAANKTANLFIHMDAKEYDAVACNALILWWHFQRTKTAVTIVPGTDKGERP